MGRFSRMLGVLVALIAGPATADTMERACMKSDRANATRALCGCIQDVADYVLSTADQRRAAAFFADPHKAQQVRQSNARRDEVFWQKYRKFGEYAGTYCG